MILPRRRMYKRIKSVPMDFLEVAVDRLASWYNVNILTEDLERVLLKDRDQTWLRTELKINSPSDTDCRETILNMICEFIGCDDWGSYGDILWNLKPSAEPEDFGEKFFAAFDYSHTEGYQG